MSNKKQAKHSLTIEVEGKKKQFDSKTAAFKWLHDHTELDVKSIAALCEVRYQQVYNILYGYTGGELRVSRGTETKSAMFRAMYDKGMTVAEISKESRSLYPFVHTVIKKYRAELAQEVEATINE